MNKIQNPGEIVYQYGEIKMDYLHPAGEIREKCLLALKETKFLASYCPKCHRTFFPARSYCQYCFEALNELVEIPQEGILKSFTVCYRSQDDEQLAQPVIYGLIEISGASELLLHYLGGIHPDQLKIGLKLKPVFRENREGQITDIAYFTPAQEG